MPHPNNRLAAVHGAALDGRTASIRFQQSQLIALHNRVNELREAILDSILTDRTITAAEAEVELSATILAVKQYYHAINFDREIKKEYRIARGEDSPNRRVAYGVVLIRPTEHTWFYSIATAAAAAIAAGNTFVIECGDYAVVQLLSTILQCLDAETYALVSGKVTEAELQNVSLIVDQTGQSSLSSASILQSRPELRSVAVVDRTADVQQAASAIVSAHRTFNGRSPHSPDLILINEWVKEEFIDACIRLGPRFLKEGKARARKKRTDDETVVEAERTGDASFLRSTSLAILDIHRRSAPVLQARPYGSYLPLLTVTSLVDAVVALESSQYTVAYHFAEPAAGKFLSQQISSIAAFVNYIPLDLLLGPAIPVYPGEPSPSPLLRYTTQMLSRPRPEYIQSSKRNTSINTDRLVQDLSLFEEQEQALVQRLRKEVDSPLRPTRQGLGTAVGFFEQGIIVGAVFIVFPIVSLVGYASWCGVRFLLWR